MALVECKELAGHLREGHPSGSGPDHPQRSGEGRPQGERQGLRPKPTHEALDRAICAALGLPSRARSFASAETGRFRIAGSQSSPGSPGHKDLDPPIKIRLVHHTRRLSGLHPRPNNPPNTRPDGPMPLAGDKNEAVGAPI